MAPKKKQAKKPAPKKATQAGKKSTDEAKKPAPKKPTHPGKKRTDVAKKTPSYKPVAKTPTAIKKEAKTKATKSTSKADLVVEDRNISDKPLGRTRAATRRAAEEEATKSTVTTLTTTTITKKSQGKAAKTSGTKSIATNERSPEPVDIASKNDTLLASPKRKRASEDKSTDTTDLPSPKSPKLHEGSSPSRSRNRRGISPRGESASERCDTREVGGDTYCTVAVELSRIPSPRANMTDRADRPILHFVNNHAYSEVKVLFHKVRDDILTSDSNGLGIGTHGTFVALQHGSTAGLKISPVRSDRPNFSLDKEGTIPSVPLDFQVSKNAKTAERDYFIINEDCDFCIINDRYVGRRLMAGPLPGFVVIFTDRWVVFWWRTRAAVDYVPRAVSEDTQGVEEEGTTKEPSPPPGTAEKGGDKTKKSSCPVIGSSDRGKDTNQPAAPLETWEDILNQNLALHRSRLDGLNHTPYEIQQYDGMDHEGVLLAVATIWDPLRNLGTYAFAGEEHLNPAFSRVLEVGAFQSWGVVGGVNGRFIMPLGFAPREKEQDKYFKENQAKVQLQKMAQVQVQNGGKSVPGPLGHILLAVARRSSPETNQVDIEIRDSLPGCESSAHIQQRAQILAADWLEMKEMTPNFAYVQVIEQPKRINACGLFTILNAWAVMLGIPLLGESKRSNHGVDNDTEFLERALEIVNLALAGCMDSRTIQAFLNVYGYSAEQDVHDLPESSVDAVRMDPARLKRRLQHQKHKDEGVPSPTPSPTSAQGSAHGSGSAQLKDTLHESLITQALAEYPELSREQAENLVRNNP